jgi:hypothetical protein
MQRCVSVDCRHLAGVELMHKLASESSR